ncbi:ABC transporter ATP-binding protein [Haloarchaeobius baliensis]|uniref:ABC transporter ATP-binding protein n=1 Tax=Haloarchaeobius baliensis TaxID=1670458 RepID=UPI003F8856AC
MSNGPVVDARNVRKEFDGETVLDGVDLQVPENEITLLMGPNGAGKTILLSCLCGALSPTDGDIEVFGGEPKAARSRLNFMIQGGLALPDLTGRENLEFYADLHPGSTDDWRDIVDWLDLDREALDQPVHEYSGGMTRKLELAVTLSVDVPLYLLDEPTAELDMTTIDRFHAHLRELVDRGKTVVLTSHEPMDAHIASHVAFVQHGRCIADGDPEALLAEVPPVLRVDGRRLVGDVAEFARDGRLFEDGQERRGFLAEGASAELARRTVDDPAARETVSTAEPTYADMFNYYTRICSWE